MCFVATFICSMILIFLWDQGSHSASFGSSIGVLVLIFIFRFAISVEYTTFYVYFNELFPTQVRVLGTGLVSMMAGVIITVAPTILQACINTKFPVMIIFAALSALSCGLSALLPETLHVDLHDEIEELRDIKPEPKTDSSVSFITNQGEEGKRDSNIGQINP